MSATSAESVLTFPCDREIQIERLVRGPRELVWRAFTEPAILARWWGPTGFEVTTRQHELKPGGIWRFALHGPDGRDYENMVTFREVLPPGRLVYRHGGDTECEPVHFEVTVTLDELAPDRTRVIMRSLFSSKAERDFVISTYGADEGGRQVLARLDEWLTTRDSTAGDEFVIRRVFAAPRERVWRAWTERDALLRWFGPRAAPVVECGLDLRVGGTFHYAMQPAGGGERMWAMWTFEDIRPPERLAFTLQFTDAAGVPVRAPFAGDWPMTLRNTVTFEEHAGVSHGTVVTIHTIAPGASERELHTFRGGMSSMHDGWGGTLAALHELLSRAAGAD